MATNAELITELYVSYFGRAPDPTGLNYWIGRANAGMSLADIAQSFSVQPETTDLYPYLKNPNVASPASFITSVYLNLFERAPDAAGLTYWEGQLSAGRPVGGIILDIINGAQDTTASKDKTTVANKVAVGLDFAQAAANKQGFEYNAAAADAAHSIVDNVTSDAATVTAAEAKTADFFGGTGGTGGSTIALTVGLDALTGTNGNDTFIGTLDATAGKSTIGLGDAIDGGNGTDTLNVINNVAGGASAVSGVTLKSIEVVNLNNVLATGAGDLLTFDASQAAALTNVNATGPGDVTITNIGKATLGVNNVTATAATQTITAAGAQAVSFSGDSVKTGAALNVDVSGGTGVTTLKVATTGTTASTISNLKIGGGSTLDTTGLAISAGANLTTTLTEATANKLQTITVAGAAKSVDLGTISSTALKSVDASGLTAGGVKIGIGANVATTFVGGAGDDTVTINGGAVITGTLAGGAGTDTIAVTAATSLTAATGKLITGFETLQVSANGAAAEAFDPTVISGITAYKVAASTKGVELLNLAANPAVTVTGNQAVLKLTLKDATGSSDVANVTLDNGKTDATVANNGITVTKLTTTGIETVNLHSNGLVSNGGTANTVTNDVAGNTALSKLVIDGSQSLKFVTGAVTTALTVDGSAATGALTIDATGATKIVNVNGGSANDTITAGDTGGLVAGGKGGDLITLKSGGATVDTVVYKAATDSVQDFVNAASKTTMDKIVNFESGTDKIDLTSFNFTTATTKVFVDKTFASTDALSTAESAATFFQDATNITRGVVAAHIGGDTYLVIDANHDGLFNAANDTVVQLSGTAALAQTDLIFG